MALVKSLSEGDGHCGSAKVRTHVRSSDSAPLIGALGAEFGKFLQHDVTTGDLKTIAGLYQCS